MESKLIEALALVGLKPGDKFNIDGSSANPNRVTEQGVIVDADGRVDPDMFIAALSDPSRITKLPQPTEHDIELLKAANTLGYPYAARDKSGLLCFYGTEPHKDIATWVTDDRYIIPAYQENTDLSFIAWTDEKPLYIPDLLERLKAD